MTSKEFVIWLKGFVAGSNNYNLTPKGWESIIDQLEKINDNISISTDTFSTGYTVTTTNDKLSNNE